MFYYSPFDTVNFCLMTSIIGRTQGEVRLLTGEIS
jgi:hypothetical protein